MKQGSALSGSMILVSTDCALLIQWSFSNGVPITYGFEIYICVYIYRASVYFKSGVSCWSYLVEGFDRIVMTVVFLLLF